MKSIAERRRSMESYFDRLEKLDIELNKYNEEMTEEDLEEYCVEALKIIRAI